MFTITALRYGVVVAEIFASTRDAADEQFARMAEANLDCEITLKERDHLIVSAGPARCSQ
jgi:hypothetical protein